MSRPNLNQAFRLVMIAKRCGSQTLYDAKCFDRAIGRVGSFAALDRDVLKIARGLIEPAPDAIGKAGVILKQSA